MGPQHAYGIAARIEQVANQALRLNQGTLYPALVRLEQKGWIKGTWQTTENSREAKYLRGHPVGHACPGRPGRLVATLRGSREPPPHKRGRVMGGLRRAFWRLINAIRPDS